MNILLTGATGMIGRRLCSFLAEQNNPELVIRALGRRAANYPGIENIIIPEFTALALESVPVNCGIDVILHLLAAGVHPLDRDPAVLKHINHWLPPQLVVLAARCSAKAVIIAGSCAEYSDQDVHRPLTESAPLETEKTYGATKAAGGLMALIEGKKHRIPAAVARIFNVYGPDEASHRLLPSLIGKLKKGEPVPLSTGTQIRDFIYVDDVCDALWTMTHRLLDGRLPSGAYNVSTGVAVSVGDFARAVARIYRCDETLLQFGALPMRSDEMPYLVGDPGLFRGSTGWQAQYTMADGLAAVMTGSCPPRQRLHGSQ